MPDARWTIALVLGVLAFASEPSSSQSASAPNSGSTAAPHLHFHISDSEALERSEGLPFTFESFEVVGEMSAERAIGAETGDPVSFKPQSPEKGLPLDRAVIRFAR